MVPPGRILGLRGDSRQPQRHRICYAHVPVVARYEHRIVRRQRIDKLFRGDVGRRPFGLVPISSQNPFALRRSLRSFANQPRKLLRAGRVLQLHVVQLHSAGNEMHVRVVESRQNEFSTRINYLGLRAAPGFDLRSRTDRNNPVAQNGYCLCHWQRFIDGPDLAVGDDQVRCRFGLRRAFACQE